MEKALIGMSGGVDSSVAAFLTQQAGYACIGATMRLFSNDVLGEDQQSTCCSLDDAEDAKSVARRMGMPHYTFNFQDAFRETVMDKFVRCYERGDTPSCTGPRSWDANMSSPATMPGSAGTRIRAAIYYTRPQTRPRIRPIFSTA